MRARAHAARDSPDFAGAAGVRACVRVRACVLVCAGMRVCAMSGRLFSARQVRVKDATASTAGEE